MRLTKNKNAILNALSDTHPETMLKWGLPPRNAATIAAMTNKDTRTVARTLRNMEMQGLVSSEIKTVEVWTELKYKQAHFPKQLNYIATADWR